jgi:hypothetical protein
LAAFRLLATAAAVLMEREPKVGAYTLAGVAGEARDSAGNRRAFFERTHETTHA